MRLKLKSYRKSREYKKKKQSEIMRTNDSRLIKKILNIARL